MYNNKPSASIIIPVYNRSTLLTYTLDSIVKQSIDISTFEVIIVDDGSSEDIRVAIEPYNKKLNLKYFFQQDKGFRAAAARNIGIQNAAAPVCIFIDASLVLGKNAVQEHLRVHQQAESPCAVIGYVYGFNNDNRYAEIIEQLIDPGDPDGSIALLRKHSFLDIRESAYQKHGDNLDTWLSPWAVFWSCNISVQKEALIRAGMFDESYTTWGGEDLDLGLALQKNKVRFVLNRSIETAHYPHPKLFSWSVDNKEGHKDFKTKQKRMHLKYDTPGTRLWIKTGFTENSDFIDFKQKMTMGNR